MYNIIRTLLSCEDRGSDAMVSLRDPNKVVITKSFYYAEKDLLEMLGLKGRIVFINRRTPANIPSEASEWHIVVEEKAETVNITEGVDKDYFETYLIEGLMKRASERMQDDALNSIWNDHYEDFNEP
jgi:hypothetical protein